jgi:hypothetical protein
LIVLEDLAKPTQARYNPSLGSFGLLNFEEDEGVLFYCEAAKKPSQIPCTGDSQRAPICIISFLG